LVQASVSKLSEEEQQLLQRKLLSQLRKELTSFNGEKGT
jgi:hypothetical protein